MKNKIKKISFNVIIAFIIFFGLKKWINYQYMVNNSYSVSTIVDWVYIGRKLFGPIWFDGFLVVVLFVCTYLLTRLIHNIYILSEHKKETIIITKYLFITLFYLLSCICIGCLINKMCNVISSVIYTSTLNNLGDYSIQTYRMLQSSNIGNIIIFIICLYLFYRFNKSRIIRLSKIIHVLSLMSKGDNDILINDKKKSDDIGYLANNIDDIVLRLKSTHKQERRLQKSRNDLVANVSHDLRTPLTSIIGYLSLIDKDEYKDEVELRYYISIVYEKSKKLNILINDLFELTKMQNYEIKLNKSNINLIELLGQLTAEFDILLKNNNMEQRLFFCKEKLTVNVDADKIVRVFENLISNSIKYAKEGHFIDVIVKKDKDFAIVDVINYGNEIPSDELPFIFDRFYKIDKSRNSENEGSGLGLSIAKNIVRLHDGTIEAYSSEEKTIFEVKLPINN